MNCFVKSQIKLKNQLYEIYTKYGYKCVDYLRLEEAIIAKIKKKDYHNILASKINDPKIRCKAYWSILKIFYNSKKIPVVPSFLTNNEDESKPLQ